MSKKKREHNEAKTAVPEEEGAMRVEIEAGETQQDESLDVAELVKERDEYLDSLQRLKAEFDNYRKRVLRERQELVKNSNRELIREMLDIIDNLERAFDSARETGDHEGPLGQGLEMTMKMLFGLLEKQGLTPIPSLGEKFDPEVHEAVNVEERDDIEPDTVIQEWQKGYLLGDQVLRAAKVVVAKPPASEDSDDTEDDTSDENE